MDSENSMESGNNEEELLAILYGLMNTYVTFLHSIFMFLMPGQRGRAIAMRRAMTRCYSLVGRRPIQDNALHRLVGVSDEECINHLRLSRDAFTRLCHLLKTAGGLSASRHTTLPEQVAMFLSILAHHTKIRVVKSTHERSGRTVSRSFHRVLNATIRLHSRLLATPLPVDDSCTSEHWRCFKGCLGALDGTYVNVTVPKGDRGRYRNRKGDISVNVLAVCDMEMNFVYVLSGWEGSAADSRVLRDALARPTGLRVPRGCYYLCYSGYCNAEGFLTPYRGTRYHLRDWAPGTNAPQNREEYFNMKHARARNVIERSFGCLKKRWGILRAPSFYPIRTQNRIIMACCLLHNFIRKHMGEDPLEEDLGDDEVVPSEEHDNYVDVVETSTLWAAWRDSLAEEMFLNRTK